VSNKERKATYEPKVSNKERKATYEPKVRKEGKARRI